MHCYMAHENATENKRQKKIGGNTDRGNGKKIKKKNA